MKRGEPLKRTTGLKRGKALERSALKRTPRRREEGEWPGAIGWTQRVFRLYGGLCLVCGKRATQGHHVVPKTVIKNDARKPLEERKLLAFDARQGMPVCGGCHEGHECGARRIPRSLIPLPALEWAQEHNYMHVIRRVYPHRP